MTSHLALLTLFAVLVSTVFAVLQKDTLRDQIRLAALMTAGFVGCAIVAGWVMLAFPLW
jgi:energy-converting hydrogenase Eha subunit C